MSRVIGIDLGTTNSCVAVLDDKGTPRILASATGERTVPSVVGWTQANEVVVGVPARRQAVSNAAATIFGTKRLIGRKVNADDVSWFARSAPFRVVAAPNGDAWVRVRGSALSPQEVSSHVLRKLRETAEAAIGETVTRAVITVPAYFDDVQRQATRDAGTIAGLDVIRILNEPTAAALAYGAHRVRDGRRIIAVFDLGGGTFDISLMAIDNGIFEVLATGGDTALGGEDWDRRMMERVSDEVFAKHRVDLTGNPLALSRLKEACEAAKQTLSNARDATISLPYLVQDNNGVAINLERKFTRDEVDLLTRDLLDRLEIPCQRALTDAGLAPADVEEVLLVGGMTRFPTVQSVVEKIFQKKPSKGANPDEIVALGAAAYAGILAGDADDATLLDVTPHDIGIKVGDSQFSVIIPRNSMLPVRARRLFATTAPDQKFVMIELYQGEHADVNKNRKLGQIVLEDLPPGPAGSVRVELALTIDVESILGVTARELRTGKQAGVTIRPSGGLSHREIVEIIARRRAETAPPSRRERSGTGVVARVRTSEVNPPPPEPGTDPGKGGEKK
jgi:molecular chaperone DnaK